MLSYLWNFLISVEKVSSLLALTPSRGFLLLLQMHRFPRRQPRNTVCHPPTKIFFGLGPPPPPTPPPPPSHRTDMAQHCSHVVGRRLRLSRCSSEMGRKPSPASLALCGQQAEEFTDKTPTSLTFQKRGRRQRWCASAMRAEIIPPLSSIMQ